MFDSISSHDLLFTLIYVHLQQRRSYIKLKYQYNAELNSGFFCRKCLTVDQMHAEQSRYCDNISRGTRLVQKQVRHRITISTRSQRSASPSTGRRAHSSLHRCDTVAGHRGAQRKAAAGCQRRDSSIEDSRPLNTFD